MASNFDFLDAQFATLASHAKRAELHIYPDPRAGCFYARFALEAAVQWLLRTPGLGAEGGARPGRGAEAGHGRTGGR